MKNAARNISHTSQIARTSEVVTVGHDFVATSGTAVSSSNWAGSSSGGGVVVSAPVPPRKNVESAVYAHIQAIRALGKTEVNTPEIARALGLSLEQVNKTVTVLLTKGVKVVDG